MEKILNFIDSKIRQDGSKSSILWGTLFVLFLSLIVAGVGVFILWLLFKLVNLLNIF